MTKLTWSLHNWFAVLLWPSPSPFLLCPPSFILCWRRLISPPFPMKTMYPLPRQKIPSPPPPLHPPPHPRTVKIDFSQRWLDYRDFMSRDNFLDLIILRVAIWSIWIGKDHFMFPRGGWEVVVDIITISGYLYYLHYYLDCGVFGKLNKLLKLVLVSFLSRVRYDTITLFILYSVFPSVIN